MENYNDDSKNRYFSLMVVGDNPDELIKKYDANIEVEPYIKYYYNDAGALRKKSIHLIQDLLDNANNAGLSDMVIDYFKERINILNGLSDFEYYTTITNGLTYNENGDALTTKNPDGKYDTCNIGKNLCIPLPLFDGSKVFKAHAGDIDWAQIHLSNQPLYELVWDLYHKNKKPQNEQEEKIYENIKTQKRYFEGFDNITEYVNYNCSYWNYAYLDEKGWIDADDYKNYEWITGFYDRFVKPLKKDSLVTIYECRKPSSK